MFKNDLFTLIIVIFTSSSMLLGVIFGKYMYRLFTPVTTVIVPYFLYSTLYRVQLRLMRLESK